MELFPRANSLFTPYPAIPENNLYHGGAWWGKPSTVRTPTLRLLLFVPPTCDSFKKLDNLTIEAMARLFASAIFCVLSFLTASAQAVELTAALDYGTFQGSYSPEYISYWRKIPFAAPPTGENRFRAPQPPLPITNGTYDSDQSYDCCPQRTMSPLIP